MRLMHQPELKKSVYGNISFDIRLLLLPLLLNFDTLHITYIHSYLRTQHYFHERCVRELAEKKCPLCRASFGILVEFPSPLKDPKEWYQPLSYVRDTSSSPRRQYASTILFLFLDIHVMSLLGIGWQISTTIPSLPEKK